MSDVACPWCGESDVVILTHISECPIAQYGSIDIFMVGLLNLFRDSTEATPEDTEKDDNPPLGVRFVQELEAPSDPDMNPQEPTLDTLNLTKSYPCHKHEIEYGRIFPECSECMENTKHE